MDRSESLSTLKLAGALITDVEGRILLLHRAKSNRTQWETPGGKIEPGEHPSRTAGREITEELGIIVTLTADYGAIPFAERGRMMLYHLYQAQIQAGEPRLVEPAFDALGWFTWEQIYALESLSANLANLARLHKRGELGSGMPVV